MIVHGRVQMCTPSTYNACTMPTNDRPSIHDSSIQDAVRVLLSNADPERGLFAGASSPVHGGSEHHYASIWARDLGITVLGALPLPGSIAVPHAADIIAAAAHRSIMVLAANQYPSGEIPTVVFPEGSPDTGGIPYADCGETGGVDSTAWWILAVRHLHALMPPLVDLDLLGPHIGQAISWLLSRDMNQTGLIDSPEAGDWMDSTLVRHGKVFYNNVLLYAALRACEELPVASEHAVATGSLANDLGERINMAFWPEEGTSWRSLVGPLGTSAEARASGIYPHPATPAAFRRAVVQHRWHYLSHITYAEFVDKCDAFANVLAILCGIPDPSRTDLILQGLLEESVRQPFPLATYTEPIAAADVSGMYKAHCDPLQGERWRNPPGSYHNGGIWPFIGGYWCAALAVCGRMDAAHRELERLRSWCAANQFNEWGTFADGSPGGNPGQSWSAGAVLLAERAVMNAGRGASPEAKAHTVPLFGL